MYSRNPKPMFLASFRGEGGEVPATAWKLEIGPSPGWETVPSW